MALTIDFHPSAGKEALERGEIESLQANRIDPKFLYLTPRQAERWRQVFLRHSPIHANPEFARLYQEAFARTADRLKPGKVLLAGLGCGTGLKELELYSRLKARGHEALFAAIDVSRDLVMESAQKLAAAGAGHERSLVCDLAESAFLAEWLDRFTGDLPRLITFFGLVPNLEPSVVTRIFRSILRPGRDFVLVSAHLAPVGHGLELQPAMQAVLPQYDNPETLAWLAAALEEAGLMNRLDAPEMSIGQIEGVPAFVAQARWKSNESFEKWGQRVAPKKVEPLRLFYSLRYTPPLFEDLLRKAGLRFERLALTSCRQEAIWLVSLA
ncbi:MAG: L-histidine N(alpha)-methyltransferase [Methylacidiphilales bacterium]|nr:L-histidine N(alpha)-methyltransferase [Candidatus Methylacidiphilales bacterium]